MPTVPVQNQNMGQVPSQQFLATKNQFESTQHQTSILGSPDTELHEDQKEHSGSPLKSRIDKMLEDKISNARFSYDVKEHENNKQKDDVVNFTYSIDLKNKTHNIENSALTDTTEMSFNLSKNESPEKRPEVKINVVNKDKESEKELDY